jgi:hypothetical protein
MKTTVLVAVTAALVALVWARAQFGSTEPPAAMPELVPGSADGTLSGAAPSRQGGASNDPAAAAPEAPITDPTVAASPGSPAGLPGKAPAASGRPAPEKKASAGRGFDTASRPAPFAAGQMLREIELKVLGRHYENVLQRALEAEEKVHVATTDSAGNAKAQPDEDAAAHQERAAVLRRYAEQLKDEITAKAAEAPVRGGASDATREYERVLKEYPVSSATPPMTRGGNGNRFSTQYAAGDSREATIKVQLLAAQARAQRGALDVERVSLEEAMEDLRRAEEAFAQKAISTEEMSRKKFAVKKIEARLVQIEAEFEAAETELAMAKSQLERMSTPPVTAPPVPTPAGIPGAAPGISSPNNPDTLPGPTPASPALPPATPGGR